MSGEGVIPSRPPIESRFRRGIAICPACNAHGRIHGSEQVSDLVKDLWVQCTNLTCGMTWKAQLAFVHVISPSALDGAPELPPPPAGFKRTIYPSGPPGSGPDPNQLAMFTSEGEGEEAERNAA